MKKQQSKNKQIQNVRVHKKNYLRQFSFFYFQQKKTIKLTLDIHIYVSIMSNKIAENFVAISKNYIKIDATYFYQVNINWAHIT